MSSIAKLHQSTAKLLLESARVAEGIRAQAVAQSDVPEPFPTGARSDDELLSDDGMSRFVVEGDVSEDGDSSSSSSDGEEALGTLGEPAVAPAPPSTTSNVAQSPTTEKTASVSQPAGTTAESAADQKKSTDKPKSTTAAPAFLEESSDDDGGDGAEAEYAVNDTARSKESRFGALLVPELPGANLGVGQRRSLLLLNAGVKKFFAAATQVTAQLCGVTVDEMQAGLVTNLPTVKAPSKSKQLQEIDMTTRAGRKDAMIRRRAATADIVVFGDSDDEEDMYFEQRVVTKDEESEEGSDADDDSDELSVHDDEDAESEGASSSESGDESQGDEAEAEDVESVPEGRTAPDVPAPVDIFAAAPSKPEGTAEADKESSPANAESKSSAETECVAEGVVTDAKTTDHDASQPAQAPSAAEAAVPESVSDESAAKREKKKKSRKRVAVSSDLFDLKASVAGSGRGGGRDVDGAESGGEEGWAEHAREVLGDDAVKETEHATLASDESVNTDNESAYDNQIDAAEIAEMIDDAPVEREDTGVIPRPAAFQEQDAGMSGLAAVALDTALALNPDGVASQLRNGKKKKKRRQPGRVKVDEEPQNAAAPLPTAEQETQLADKFNLDSRSRSRRGIINNFTASLRAKELQESLEMAESSSDEDLVLSLSRQPSLQRSARKFLANTPRSKSTQKATLTRSSSTQKDTTDGPESKEPKHPTGFGSVFGSLSDKDGNNLSGTQGSDGRQSTGPTRSTTPGLSLQRSQSNGLLPCAQRTLTADTSRSLMGYQSLFSPSMPRAGSPGVSDTTFSFRAATSMSRTEKPAKRADSLLKTHVSCMFNSRAHDGQAKAKDTLRGGKIFEVADSLVEYENKSRLGSGLPSTCPDSLDTENLDPSLSLPMNFSQAFAKADEPLPVTKPTQTPKDSSPLPPLARTKSATRSRSRSQSRPANPLAFLSLSRTRLGRQLSQTRKLRAQRRKRGSGTAGLFGWQKKEYLKEHSIRKGGTVVATPSKNDAKEGAAGPVVKKRRTQVGAGMMSSSNRNGVPMLMFVRKHGA